MKQDALSDWCLENLKEFLRTTAELEDLQAAETDPYCQSVLRTVGRVLGATDAMAVVLRKDGGDDAGGGPWHAAHLSAYNADARVARTAKRTFIDLGDYLSDPVAHEAIATLSGPAVTSTHSLVESGRFTASELAEELGAVSLVDRLFVTIPVNRKTLVCFSWDRVAGQRPYDAINHQILEALLPALGRMAFRVALVFGAIDGGVPLSSREREVVAAAICGLSESEIADELALRASTIHQYLIRTYRKLAVNSRMELILRWFRAA